jgi:hypothetical protein
VRKNYKEKINLFELAERGEAIIKFFAETSTSDYNELPILLQQAIEFIYGCLRRETMCKEIIKKPKGHFEGDLCKKIISDGGDNSETNKI